VKTRKYRIFADASVLFSAAKTAGPMRRLLLGAQSAGHILLTDAFARCEAQRNTSRLAGASAARDLEAMLCGIEISSTRPTGKDSAAAHSTATVPQHAALLAALALKCDILVSSDHSHLGTVFGSKFGSTQVLSAVQLARMLGANSPEGQSSSGTCT
jgi:hypothetical protein